MRAEPARVRPAPLPLVGFSLATSSIVGALASSVATLALPAQGRTRAAPRRRARASY